MSARRIAPPCQRTLFRREQAALDLGLAVQEGERREAEELGRRLAAEVEARSVEEALATEARREGRHGA